MADFAGISFADTTSAAKVSKWITIDIEPGLQFESDPADANANRVRWHKYINRYRILQGPPLSYSPMNGMIGTGSVISSYYTGLNQIHPIDVTENYLCTKDRIVKLFPGVFRQEQVWEHFGEYLDFDTDLLKNPS